MNERYFSARTMKTKRVRRTDITRLRDELSDLLRSDRGLPEADARKMAAWDPFDQNASAKFFDPEWMFGLSTNFDLVIGNPPYVRHESIRDQKAAFERHYGGKDAKGNPLGAYASTADLFVYFIQRGIKLLNPGGAFAYITSSKWYRARYGERLRSWMTRNARLRQIIDFGDAEVFDALAYPTIIIATRRQTPVPAPADGEMVRVLNWPEDRERSEVEGFPALIDSLGFDVPQKALTGDSWQLEPQASRGLLDQIRAAGMPLGRYVEGRLYRGILTGLNDAFVVDGPTRARLIAEHGSSAEVIKPYLRGRDIKRWRVEPEDLWLIFTRRGIDIGDYPAVERHLSAFRDRLEPKPDGWDEGKDGPWRGRKGGTYKWYEIQDNVAYWESFEQPKIFVPAIQNKVDYAADLEFFYGNDKTSIIVDERWPYLLAILNSPVSWWLTQQSFASRQGGFYEFKPMYVAQVPIPATTEPRQALIGGIVKAVVCGAADARLHQLLNGLVYELFFPEELLARGLTIFDAAANAGFARLASLAGEELRGAARELAEAGLASSQPLYGLLFDLQALDVVRIVEHRE